MTTKRIPLALALLFIACIALAYGIASFRPFGSTEKFAPALTPTAPPLAAVQVPPTAIPSRTTNPLPTRLRLETSIAQAATPLPTHTLTLDPTSAVATQTSASAVRTWDAIATRALATPRPLKPETPWAISNTTNFLLIGTDTRTADPNWQPNTDVLMVLFLDTTNRRAALLSLPRDLVVAIPGHEAFRINYAYHFGWEKQGPAGGVDLLNRVLRNDFGIRIDHWALIDFDGLSRIINTLGGIDVQVPCALTDTIDDQTFTIPAGNVQMDYLTAKRYVQSRYSTSDTSRNFRQQRVVWAMAKKALELNAPDRIPLVYDRLKDSVATDMSVLDLVSLVPALYQLDLQNHPERLHARVLEAPAVYPWISPSGAWLYMPDYDLIAKELDTIFDAPPVATQATPAECPAQASTPPPTDSPTVTATPPP